MQENDAVSSLFEMARKSSVDLEILIHADDSFSVSYQDGAIDKYDAHRGQCLGVRVLNGDHVGVAWTESLEKNAIARIFTDAKTNSQFIKKDPKPQLVPNDSEVIDVVDVSDLKTDLEEKMAFAKRLEIDAKAADARIAVVPYSGYQEWESRVRVLHSEGLDKQHQSQRCMAWVSPVAREGDLNKTGSASQFSSTFKSLEGGRLIDEAVTEAIEKLDATSLVSGTYTILFHRRAAESLVRTLGSMMSAKRLDEKTTPLTNFVGKQCFSKAFHLTDDPLMAGGGGWRPFDSEGVRSQRTELVSAGTFNCFLSNFQLAQKMGIANTANAYRSPQGDLDVQPSNLTVTPGNKSLRDLICGCARVVVVDSLSNAGLNPVSGRFSLQAGGTLFERGNRCHAVEQITVSGDVMAVFAQIVAVANDQVLRPSGIVTPSLLVEGLQVAGKG